LLINSIFISIIKICSIVFKGIILNIPNKKMGKEQIICISGKLS
jgi:hypothetical protein